MSQIPTDQLELLLLQMERAERFCRNARPSVWPMSEEDRNADCTEFYSGACGYAGSAMRNTIQTLRDLSLIELP